MPIISVSRWRIPSEDATRILKDVALYGRGLVVLAGASGSGKSTALAAMVDWRNEKSYGHIITVEDPVEFVHPHMKATFNQRELGTDFDSFSSGLRAALRQADRRCLRKRTRKPSSLIASSSPS